MKLTSARKTILMIAAGVIAAHLIVIYFSLTPGSTSKPDAPEKDKTEKTESKTTEATAKPSVFLYDNAVTGNLPALPASKDARSGILIDLDRNRVLWAKNPQKAVPIASMTKIMTLCLAIRDVQTKRNQITMQTPVKVTRSASRVGGSSVWLDPRETFRLEELFLAAALRSANDATFLIAEFFGNGNVRNFVGRMNQFAREIGMKQTRYYNPHGLPGKTAAGDNVSTAEDMARLAAYALTLPELMKLSSTRVAGFRPKNSKAYQMLTNHNGLLPKGKFGAEGVDGLKTGFTDRAGFCSTITCQRNGRRMVAMVSGFPSAASRDKFLRDLLNWGYRQK